MSTRVGVGRSRPTLTPLARRGDRAGTPAAVADTLTIERIDAPDAEAPGNSVTVTASISCQAVPFTNCEAAVTFSLGDETLRVPQSGTRDIPEAGRDEFSATFTMPQSSASIGVEALEQGAAGRFNVEDEASVPIEAITEQEKTQRAVVGFVPWTLGGAGIGAGAASLTDRPVAGGAIAGGGVGVATKVVAENIGGFPNLGNIVPEFPTTAVLATAALLGAAALLLIVTPLDEILLGSSLGAAASSAVSRAAPSQ